MSEIKTSPTIRKLPTLEPGIYLTSAGRRGVFFAIPFATEGKLDGSAMIFGTPDDKVEQGSISADASYLLPNAEFVLPPLREMASGSTLLMPGCLAAQEGAVAVMCTDGWNDPYWIDLATGAIHEPRTYRHYFRSWTLVDRSGDWLPTKLFEWRAPDPQQ